jgi:hypothetical protein
MMKTKLNFKMHIFFTTNSLSPTLINNWNNLPTKRNRECFCIYANIGTQPFSILQQKQRIQKNFVVPCTCKTWLEYRTNQVNSTWHMCNHKTESHK